MTQTNNEREAIARLAKEHCHTQVDEDCFQITTYGLKAFAKDYQSQTEPYAWNSDQIDATNLKTSTLHQFCLDNYKLAPFFGMLAGALSQNEQQEAVAYMVNARTEQGLFFDKESAEIMAEITCNEVRPLYTSPPKQAIPDITVETKLPFDIYFGKGKVGKGCTFDTLIKRISAQSSFVDELIAENEELHKKLGTPSKREILNRMLNAAPTNTEVGE